MHLLGRTPPWRHSLQQHINSCASLRLKFKTVPHPSIFPHKQRYTSPSIPWYRYPSFDEPSPQELILSELERHRHNKWGWVIYRTSYTPYSDQKWDRFKYLINSESRNSLIDSNVQNLDIEKRVNQALEWTFISDPSTLDGATIPELRTRFKEWTKENFVRENPHATYPLPDPLDHLSQAMTNRYLFFVQVDEASLRSVIEAPRNEPPMSDYHIGEVNFVNAYWKPDEDYDPESAMEPVDGCVEEDVGWMKIASWMLAPDFYADVGFWSDEWWRNYVRPPETSYFLR